METKMRHLFLSALAGIALAACGSSGTLSLELTDAPPDTAKIASVFVTLSRVEAHRAEVDEKKDGDPNDSSIDNDDKWVTVPLPGKEFDLLELQNDTTAALGALDLPEGKVTQVRLFIDRAGRNEVLLKAGGVCPMDLQGVVSTGIKINHPFKAFDVKNGMLTKIVLDFDLMESVSEDGACQYSLKPVIKIKLDKSSMAEKK